jgi:CxxC motif-containing protein
MEKIITCTICPRGCEIKVIGQNGKIDSIIGFSCNRGKPFATNEFILPKRIFTSTVKLEDSDELLLPVRSDAPIPKETLFACMEIIRNTTIKAPVNRGDIVIPNILDLNCNIITCKSAERHTI